MPIVPRYPCSSRLQIMSISLTVSDRGITRVKYGHLSHESENSVLSGNVY